jgi:hypothetical protein
MKAILAATLLVGLSVAIAKADDNLTRRWRPNTLPHEEDWRLATKPAAQPKKIGVLTYFPNNGGGYTFLEGEHIAFYALPFLPTTYPSHRTRFVTENRHGFQVTRAVVETTDLVTVGTSKMPFGAHTVYRPVTKMTQNLRREDTPIVSWTRDSRTGTFRLSITAKDSETRVKLKSIVPVLERAEHAP